MVWFGDPGYMGSDITDTERRVNMNAKKLSKMIRKMTDTELYAFVSSTVLEIKRRSDNKIPTNEILSGILFLCEKVERSEQ